jgi:thioredoxin reductase (NADPH)
LQVHLLVRGDRMRASKAMQDRVLRHPNVTVHLNTGIEDAYGDDKAMQGLNLVDTKTGREPAQGAAPTLGWGAAGMLLPWRRP